MKKFLAICALMLAGVPVGAIDLNEKNTFNCVSTAFALSGETTDWNLKSFSPETFGMYSDGVLVFIKDKNNTIPVMTVINKTEETLEASKEFDRVKIRLIDENNLKLVYTRMGYSGVSLMTADCVKTQ